MSPLLGAGAETGVSDGPALAGALSPAGAQGGPTLQRLRRRLSARIVMGRLATGSDERSASLISEALGLSASGCWSRFTLDRERTLNARADLVLADGRPATPAQEAALLAEVLELAGRLRGEGEGGAAVPGPAAPSPSALEPPPWLAQGPEHRLQPWTAGRAALFRLVLSSDGMPAAREPRPAFACVEARRLVLYSRIGAARPGAAPAGSELLELNERFTLPVRFAELRLPHEEAADDVSVALVATCRWPCSPEEFSESLGAFSVGLGIASIAEALLHGPTLQAYRLARPRG